VTQRLQAAPEAFDFLQAVRRIEGANRDRPPMGHSGRVGDDPVRFGQKPYVDFASSTVDRFEPAVDDKPARLFVNFIGLLGPNGPMPIHFTEYVMERIMSGHDRTLARFLDIFHHRMISLFYDAWARNQQTVSYERGGENDRFAAYLASFFGMGMPSFLNRDSVPDLAKIYYSGRLVCPTRHAEGLRAILEDYFKIKTTIQEFVGQWIHVSPGDQCRVGESPRTGQLGRTVVVGSMVWDCSQKFRVRLGPMSFADYTRMLPAGDSFRRLCDWLKNYVGYSLAWDAQLVLRAEEVPQASLGKLGQLGWTTWLKSKPFIRDADELVVQPAA
jgi:type VI secretion system protein ImpH